MSLFYTRKGDNGKSHVGRRVIEKTRIEIEALGQLDELNSMTGILKSQKISRELIKILHEVQENLFIIQSHVAAVMLNSKFKAPKFKSLKVKDIEKVVDDIERKLPPLKKFVISGANQVSAWLDFLRAKSRNVERSMLRIKKVGKLDPEIRKYLNRLSSLFFALARWEARNRKEKNPKYK